MTIEEFIARSSSCSTIEELGALFASAVADAGYQNASFARIDRDGILAVPILVAPSQFPEAYVDLGCYRDDAVLTKAQRTSQPFYWDDVAREKDVSAGGLRTFSVCREAGVHSGLSIPFHGPGGVIDLVGVSLKDEQKADREAAGKIVALSAIMRWRYWQLRNALEPGRSLDANEHNGGASGMTDSQCRSLVLVALSAHRWQIGLAQMSNQLTDYVSENDLAHLLSWGFVVEKGDDTTFRYHYVLSPLGMQHIQNCANAKRHRRDVWDAEVSHGERSMDRG